jgi:hypothetical protein
MAQNNSTTSINQNSGEMTILAAGFYVLKEPLKIRQICAFAQGFRDLAITAFRQISGLVLPTVTVATQCQT